MIRFVLVLKLFIILILNTSGLEISSKLGSEFASTSSLTVKQPSQLLDHHQKESFTTKKYDNIKINNNNPENFDKQRAENLSINDNIEIHVKTSVQVNNNNKENEKLSINTNGDKFETPDIPVIIGYAGVEEDNKNKGIQPSFINNQQLSLSTPSIIHSQSGLVYQNNGLKSRNYNNYKSLINNQDVNNLRNILPLTRKNLNSVGARKNYLHFPYFEPSYNRHYFGETPPPEYVLGTKYVLSDGGNLFNPVEFKDVPFNSYQHDKMYNTRNNAPGLQWYPTSTRKLGITQKIDNKLLPPFN